MVTEEFIYPFTITNENWSMKIASREFSSIQKLPTLQTCLIPTLCQSKIRSSKVQWAKKVKQAIQVEVSSGLRHCHQNLALPNLAQHGQSTKHLGFCPVFNTKWVLTCEVLQGWTEEPVLQIWRRPNLFHIFFSLNSIASGNYFNSKCLKNTGIYAHTLCLAELFTDNRRDKKYCASLMSHFQYLLLF